MNIFGEGFPEEVLKQIKYRQQIYGSGYSNNRSSEEIVYLNSKTSWCKLISGVNISSSADLNNPTIKSLGLSDNNLAEKFVLFNGTATEGGEGLRKGISPNNSILGGDYAYGIGGNDFGIKPMMGIQQASIRHENGGSLRRAEVKIKAFNKAQFDIIDTLYLRQGFSVLLEWGHSIIIDNNGNIDFNPTNISLSDDFLTGNNTYDAFLQKIYNQRLAYGGNYDAMLAKIMNFSWSFLPDGSYDITVYLTSIGDLIESLKVNILTDSPGNGANVSSREDDSEQKIAIDVLSDDESDDIIDAFAFSHNIGNFLYFLKKSVSTLAPEVDEQEVRVYELSLNPSNPDLKNQINNIVNNSAGIIKIDTSIFDEDQGDVLINTYDNLGGGDWYDKSEWDDLRYYVRLGTFLKFLQTYIFPTYYSKNNKKHKSLYIDTSPNTNLMNALPYQISVDPRICFVQKGILIGIDQKLYSYGVSNPKSPFINQNITQATDKKSLYGNIMNIYLDTSFILRTIEEKKDDKGNLVVIDFLKSLMAGINEGLGGINDFDVFLDETNNTIRIIDKNPLNNVNQVIKYLNANFPDEVKSQNNNRLLNDTFNPDGILQLYGYSTVTEVTNGNSTGPSGLKNTTLAGFIKEFNLTTTVSPAFSNMITIGAVSRGSVVGENDTALSRLNRGLSDRFKIAVTNDPNPPDDVDSNNSINQKTNEFNKMWNDYVGFLKKLSNSVEDDGVVPIDSSEVDKFKSNLPSILQKGIDLKKLEGSFSPEMNQGTGFLPFNLSLTMDGLSGIKINQRFIMDTSYMPSNYPDVLNFQIKNLSHEISNNKWTTKIDTYAIANNNNNLTKDYISGDQGVNVNPSSNLPLGSNGNLPASKLRIAALGAKLSLKAADAWDKLVAAAKADGVPNMSVRDSYRTYDEQYAIFDWNLYVATGGSRNDKTPKPGAKKFKKGTNATVEAAFPGTSNHGLGNAVDAHTTEFQKWIKIYGWEFGWSWYEGKSINEDWHFTYTENPAYLKSYVNYTNWSTNSSSNQQSIQRSAQRQATKKVKKATGREAYKVDERGLIRGRDIGGGI